MKKGLEARWRPSSLLPSLLVALLILGLALWGSLLLAGPRVEDSLTRIGRGGALRIGYAVEAPYAFVSEGGRVTGESPELARAVAERLGIARVEWRRLVFAELIPALREGRIDVIAAGMFVTPSRSKLVHFSLPSFRAREGLLVGAGAFPPLRSYRELVEGSALKIAVLEGSTEEASFAGLGMPAARLLRVPSAATGLAALASGLVDGLALSAATVHWMAMHEAEGRARALEPFDQGGGGSVGAFAFRLGDEGLARAWDGVLGSFVGSREHLELIARFGFGPEDLPLPQTREAGR